VTTYWIDQGLLKPLLEIEIEETPPPCLFCGEPVAHPSMGGPLICGACDCGHNQDGSKWTEAQAQEYYRHRKDQVARYREAAALKRTENT
jgi:hypothetical protein